ncbi:LamG domain-containing protein [Halorussus lipolyticus]|uniref:LamG domain-containing protein n=1 Tax=Halorussus lipolyticus TaxID=3034024 RepID=UPI0023E7B75F|nr:LamG domain-containing protein [Halorussus sp. DT80]
MSDKDNIGFGSEYGRDQRHTANNAHSIPRRDLLKLTGTLASTIGFSTLTVSAQSEKTFVNAKTNGATADITQDTWKGSPVDMIDDDPDTQWQVAGNPNTIIAIFTLPHQARVTEDYLRIGTGGDRDVTEYELYARDSPSDSWSLKKVFSGSVTGDGTPDVRHTFESDPLEGKQFKLVITEHRAPDLCYTACDVPIREYQLLGKYLDTPSPEANYDFEGTGTTVVDRSGNGHTGEIVRADRVTDHGGTVINFDKSNNSYVRLGQEDTLDPLNGSYTVSFWFKSDGVSGGNETLFAKRGDSNERFRITLFDNGEGEGRLAFRVKDDPSLGNDHVKSDTTYTNGQWHRVDAVRDTDADQIELYVDYEPIGTAVDHQGDINPTGPAYLGGQPEYPNTRYYTGRIDDVTIYKAAVRPNAKTTTSISITNPRLVQSVENSRLDNNKDVINDSEFLTDDTHLSDPPLVANKATAFMFDITGENVDQLGGPVTVSVAVNGETQGELMIQAATVQDVVTSDVALFDKLVDNGNFDSPVFTVEEGDTVSLTVTGEGLETADQELTIGEDESEVSIVTMPALNVGVMPVERPDDYGTLEDSRFSYVDKVEQIAKQMQFLFPTHRVNIYRYTAGYVKGEYKKTFSRAQDFIFVQQTLNDLTPVTNGDDGEVFSVKNGDVIKNPQMEISAFDVTIAMLPEKYFDFHNWWEFDESSLRGVEPIYPEDADGDGVQDLQPPASTGVLISAPPATAEMEVGHHFINTQYPSSLADDGDTAHATPDLYSTTYYLSQSHVGAITGANSFMAHNGSWMDAKTFKLLIESGFDPVPEEGTLKDRVMSVSGTITDTSELLVDQMREIGSGLVQTAQDGVSVRVINVNGDTLESITVPQYVSFFTDEKRTPRQRAVTANIPYPADTYEVIFEVPEPNTGEITTTVVVPTAKQLSTLIEWIPESGFTRNPPERKTALRKKSERSERLVEKKKFRPAINTLRNDIRDKLEKWLKDDYEATVNEYSKQETLEVVDNVLEQWEQFAQQTTSGNSNSGKSSRKQGQ